MGAANAPAGWDRSMGTGLTIAIIDDPFDVNHPDLSGKITSAWNAADQSTSVAD